MQSFVPAKLLEGPDGPTERVAVDRCRVILQLWSRSAPGTPQNVDMKTVLGVVLSVTAVVCAISIALVLAGVWSPPWVSAVGSDNDGSVSVSQGNDVTLLSNNGSPEIRIPASAFTGSGQLEVKPVDLPEDRRGWAIQLSGAHLTGKATLVFKDAITDGAPPPLVGFNENPNDPIQYVLDAEISGKDLMVHTTHFSNWVKEAWDAAMNWARGQLDRIYRDSGTGEQPKCDRETEARAGNVSVASDDGGRVRWCLGKSQDGSTVLKVNNSRGYAVSAERTKGLSMNARSLDFGQMVPRLAKYITAPSKPGNVIDIIGPGETVEYRVDAASGEKGVRLQPSPPAYLATALWFGVETVGMVYTKVLGKIPMETINSAVDAANCVAGFQSMATADVTNAKAAANYLNGATGTVMSCMGKVFERIAKGKMLDMLAVGIAQVFSWVWSGLQTAANGFAAAADTALNINGYTITLKYQVAAAPSSPRPSSIPGMPAAVGGKWCTRSTPAICFSDVETKAKYPSIRVQYAEPSDPPPGATDYTLCIQMDLGNGCSTASTIFLRYFPTGVGWNCVQAEVLRGFKKPACDPDYSSAHDTSQPRLVVLLNHQQGPTYSDQLPMYKSQ
uniref:Uncharacterized protein n=2 Tax=Paenarthrobacter nicotinovorans TaxID=29320 RepID=Q8GAK1_PAENI|nr:hypothetical protein [Paenarthrobacter nicotinovorans]